MLEMSLSLQELILFILFVLLVVAAVYLIITLKKFSGILDGVQRMLDTNESYINDSLQKTPQISDNAVEISEIVKDSLRFTHDAVPAIMGNVTGITGSINHSVQSIDSSVSSMGEGIEQTMSAVQESATGIQNSLAMFLDALRALLLFLSELRKNKKAV